MITSAPLVVMVPQRHQTDCGAAALAMFLSVSYEEVLLALGDGPLKGGVWFSQLIRAAQTFGVTLRRKPKWDPETEEGLAQIRLRHGPHHVLLLRAGLFFETDLTVWEPDELLRARRGRLGSLLVRED